MSQFYNPKRGASWNYGGGNWKLSRSKIDLFVSCPRCFYLDNKLGTKRPPGFPFNLNSAVDHLLKKEFDIHRAGQTTHPLTKEYGLTAVPFQHRDINKWRDNFVGVQTLHEPTGMTISGAIDDVWIDDDGSLIVVDYKATSKEGEVNLDAEWQDGYKRQMEVYQWLLRKNNFDVSDTGYFVYANGITDREAFDGKLEFDIKLIPYTGSDDWVEGILQKIHACLNDDRTPAADSECDYCAYRTVAGQTLQARKKLNKGSGDIAKEPTPTTPEKTKPTKSEKETGSLF